MGHPAGCPTWGYTMSIRIVTDSTCDIPADLQERHGILVLPAYINIGDQSYLDGVELSRQTFYTNLPDYPRTPTTAAPATGTFAAAYEKLAGEGATEILSIHVAASLSGILNAARLGAEAADAVPVTLFDSRQLSMGLGLLALTAARAAQAGHSMGAIVALLEERVQRTHVLAVLDTLEFLRRSGRVSWTEFSLGTLLKIKPLVHVHDSEVKSLGRIRTQKRAVEEMLQFARSLAPLEQVAFLHTQNPAGAAAIQEALQAFIPAGQQPPVVEVTPAIGAHIGPGAVGLACITTT